MMRSAWLPITWFVVLVLPVRAADPPTLVELHKAYQSLGLPALPDSAILVRYPANDAIVGKANRISYRLTFQVKTATEKDGPIISDGLNEWSVHRSIKTDQVNPDSKALNNVEFTSPDDALLLAIQCHARGYSELATALFKHKSNIDANVSALPRLHKQAWEYWRGQVSHPTSDRRVVAKRLRELIKIDVRNDTQENRDYVAALELANVPGRGKPGTHEALIDQLVDFHHPPFQSEEPALFWKIAELGFDIVPTLLEHMQDRRLTRTRSPGGFNLAFPNDVTVGDVVRTLLEMLAVEELREEIDNRYRFSPRMAIAWWDRVQRMGEESYLLARVFSTDLKQAYFEEVNEHVLRILALKHPRQIPLLYRRMLTHHENADADEVAESLGRCKLPRKVKVACFLEAANHRMFRHRFSALWELNAIDPQLFDKQLVNTLDSIPKESHGDHFRSQDTWIITLALKTRSSEVWSRLDNWVKQSRLKMPTEMLQRLAAPYWIGERVRRLQLLTLFLDDVSVVEVTDDRLFGKDHSGSIELRNYVAILLAELCGIPSKLKPGGNSAEWAQLRAQIRVAVQKEVEKQK